MTTVIHTRDKTGAADEVYIGRGSLFGNPVALGKKCPVCGEAHQSRGSTLKCYKVYLFSRLKKDEEFQLAVQGLWGKTLVCFCKPLPCHGDILAKVADYLERRPYERIWIHHPESCCVFVGTRADIPGHDMCCEELGLAHKGDIEEAILLLKSLGWSAREPKRSNSLRALMTQQSRPVAIFVMRPTGLTTHSVPSMLW